ncbi:glycosyltransferase family 2 protein [Stenomitos frigidus]|uniref:Glycosyltransferase family 2 protein n=1 Tax=Stenomitos frigidus ULC18 TaxID=2107698 RepID=A0A2T1E3B7_9CYAN|nr:glycosyltransferase family 2 protein [Stenomitos frigidus]PSB27226.1 hypothetical protein C7B82_17315 [Stenomitos frigidus ULC18]
MGTIQLAIGIVLYKNDLNLLYKSLLGFKEQLLSSLPISIELGIIDNSQGSQLRQVLKIADDLNLSVSVSQQGENIGFGAGHNCLFRNLQAMNREMDYYLCANPDGIPHQRMIENLVVFAQARNNQGLFEARQFPIEHPKIYDPKTFATGWCSGCCLLIPFPVYERLDGFDESFFLYCEDVDLSWRAQMLGYQCYTVPNALFYHYVFGEDRNISRQDLEMTISAYKLAAKYGNIDATQKELLRLRELVSQEELQKICSVDLKKIPLDMVPTYIDFNHGRYFSPSRW